MVGKMMDFKLENGKTLFVKGSKFTIEVTNTSIVIAPDAYSQKFDEVVEEIFSKDMYDETPAYIKSKEPTKIIKLSRLEEQSNENGKIVEIGKNVFNSFIKKWAVNWGEENTEQPDRAKLMNDTMSDYSLHVIRYIKQIGGLTSASMRAFPTDDYEDTDYRKRIRLLAENIAQVSSILCPPMSDLLEYPFLINIKLFTDQGENNDE